MAKDKKEQQVVPIPNVNGKKPSKKINWAKLSTIPTLVVIVLVGIWIGTMTVVNQSDTNPNFCGSCHLMKPNVTSYLTSSNMDHVHQQAGVECKDCHDYPLSAEITSGVNFLIGNYTVDKSGKLIKARYSDEMCNECHISYEHVIQKTDFLFRNPHDSHFGQLACRFCHISHGQQIDYCSQCHNNGGQRMIDQPIQPRDKIGQLKESNLVSD